jgi:hypothetical protein
MAGPTSIIPPIPITAEDKFSRVFDQLRKRATDTFKDVTGSVRETSEAGKKLSEAFEPFAKLAGVGGALGAGLGLAGAIEGIERFARSGAEIGRTSARIGVGAQALQDIGHAAYLAGANATAGAQGLEALGEKLHGAAWGRDQEAIAVFKEFGIAVRDANGHVRRADEVLPEVADKIKSLRDPYQQAALATALLGSAGRDLLPYLRDGAEGLTRYREEVKKHGAAISEVGLKAAKDFEEAQRNLELSAKGMGNALAEYFVPKLTPAIQKTTEWLDELRKSPGAMKAIETGATALSALLGVTLLTSVAKLTTAMVKMNLAFAGSILGSGALRFLGPLGSFVATMWPGAAGKAGQEGRTGERPGGANYDDAERAGIAALSPEQAQALLNSPSGRALSPTLRALVEKRARGETITPGGTGVGHVAPRAERAAFIRQYARSKGLNPDAVLATAAGEGLNVFTGDKGTSFGDFQLHVGGGMGDAAVKAGINIRDPNAWKTADTFAIDQMAAHRGDPAWFASQWHGAPAWAANSYSAGGAADRLNRGYLVPPGTPFNSQGQPYSRSLETMSPQEKANVAASMAWIKSNQGGTWGAGPRFLPDVPDYSGAMDSNHHVSIDINGMPQGGRARLLDAQGPAKLNLRVQQAMSSP